MNAVAIQKPGKLKGVRVDGSLFRPDYLWVKAMAFVQRCDYSAIVDAGGKACNSNILIGDQIYGLCYGGNNIELLRSFTTRNTVYVRGFWKKSILKKQQPLFSLPITWVLIVAIESSLVGDFTHLWREYYKINACHFICQARSFGMTALSTTSLKPIDPVESLSADEVLDHQTRLWTNNQILCKR
ncbi:uncharacterized protein EAE98_000930 [Botrytis deweyae]|uniref:Uncharacterized protein n=1 Tax=Botrytis deweyae TaxID=2478750 RepID=A0ABQ7J017_9HELO|nr:uncharacterized protein EAE98_000930 [Botrytis deweyae]KAF7938592.1 hypothetical protein EAE98_000930 [Botrytis deweyae]